MTFQPDYRHMLDVLANRRPARLPLYEHKIDPTIMEQVLGIRFAALEQGDEADLHEFFAQVCRFYREMTYDTVSWEVTITRSLPDHGAIYGSRKGPIQTRADFEAYPWDDVPKRFWETADRKFRAMGACLPPGMQAIGGPGNGVFEISEDLVGFQYLAYMLADDPELFADLFRRIGDLMVEIWAVFLAAPRRALRHLPLRRRPGLPQQHAAGAADDPRAHPTAVSPGDRPSARGRQAVPSAFLW